MIYTKFPYYKSISILISFLVFFASCNTCSSSKDVLDFDKTLENIKKVNEQNIDYINEVKSFLVEYIKSNLSNEEYNSITLLLRKVKEFANNLTLLLNVMYENLKNSINALSENEISRSNELIDKHNTNFINLNEDINLFIEKVVQSIAYIKNYKNTEKAKPQNEDKTKKEALKSLGLDPESTYSDEEIRKQYRKMAKKYHPDKNKTKEAAENFIKIAEAYNALFPPSNNPLE